MEISGYDTSGKKVVKKRKKAKALRPNIKQAKSASEDTLKIITRGESQEQIDARVRLRWLRKMKIRRLVILSLSAILKLVAGATILLRNFGVFSGKYLIKSSRHTISRSGGYTTHIEVRMLEFIADDLITLGMEAGNANA